MITNSLELQKALKIDSLAELNSVFNEFDERVISFSLSLIEQSEQLKICPSLKNNPNEEIGININYSSDFLPGKHNTQIKFPFEIEDFLSIEKEQYYRCLKALIRQQYGCQTINEQAFDYILSYVQLEEFVNALIEPETITFQNLPETIEECIFCPEYEKDNWLAYYHGQGIQVDEEGIWGLLTSYDDCDWETEQFNLLSTRESYDFFLRLNEGNEWDEQGYLEWIIEHKKDPLQYFLLVENEEQLKDKAKKRAIELKKDLSFDEIVYLVQQERDTQRKLAFNDNTDDFDKQLKANDFIALSMSYLGRAVQKSFRNDREGQLYRDNVIKGIALLFASLETESTALDG